MVLTPTWHLIANQGLQLNQRTKWTLLNMDSTRPTATAWPSNNNFTFQDTHISINSHRPLQKRYGIVVTTTYRTILTNTPAFINMLILMLTTIITTQYMFTRCHILEATTTFTRILPTHMPILTSALKLLIITTTINMSIITTRPQERHLRFPTCHDRWVL
ncbi:hypothetical protein BG006_008953 [Podila minutissima]|uniref:Uncharacterized protein n=1 Tax=Podila minutissima TaxID=64525 RepID=A0A9P5VJM8_9FUNG|nr:hypothetical protein BG006_008953 [Podila minutissima]